MIANKKTVKYYSKLKNISRTLKIKMFKTNLSPLNPNKDKYTHNNYPSTAHDIQNPNHHQPAYQYKGIYTGNNNLNYKQDLQSPHTNYNPPLSPLSPNINKNPMSPTAKIKMFSNTLTLNKKNSQNTNPILQPNTQDFQNKQTKIFNKLGIKNLTLNLNESMDLKCDEVLEQTSLTTNYRKETPQQPVKQNLYPKRTGTKIPQLNFEQEIDDLKCDEILEIRKDNQDDSKRNLRFNNANGYHNGCLSNNDLENNFTYTNMANKNFSYQNNEKNQSQQAPLTPGYDRKKTIPLISMRKNTERQNNPSNNSNPSSNIVIQPQKPRSFTNVISPHIGSKHQHQENNEQENEKSALNQSNPSIEQLALQKRYQNMMKLVQRTRNVIETYQREADQAKEKLNEARDKLNEAHERNSFLEKENMQLRKCLYEEGSSSSRNNPYNYPLTPGANRYQGIK